MSIDVSQDAETRYRALRTEAAQVVVVPDPLPDADADSDESAAAGFPLAPLPFPPSHLRRSGVYRLDRPDPLPHVPLPPVTTRFGTEELRVDVDGVKPTMTVSGTVTRLFGGRLTWIARVSQDPTSGAWTGPISYRDGDSSLRPHLTVTVRLTGGPFRRVPRKAEATFSGGTASTVTLTYTFQTAAFREVAFEYDTVSDATAVTSHDPTTHPNHSPAAPSSLLTLESGYARLGIQVTKTGGDSAIPVPAGTWSDLEMHDAMQAHWSRWADAPQWAVWVLFARQHDQGPSLGGIMFDDIGTAQRQGTAIFGDSFIAQAPAGEPDPGPWVERMKFWTAMHEIGHAFNLAHSWQKELGTAWVPTSNEPEALSYMNYPFNFPAGLDAFFAAFDYAFSPDELLFLRHAPERFVKMGAAPWFSDHAFEQDAFEHLRAAVTGPLELELRVHREPRFEFLEPVVAELRLKNVSSMPTMVDSHVLEGDTVAIVVAKDGGEARRWLPFVRRCAAPAPRVLQPGESMYESIFLSAGTGGWLVSEPGSYTVYAVSEAGPGGAVLSRPLTIVVDPPATAEAERLAGDVFTRQVAHTLAFGGSRVLTAANGTLQEVAERLPGSQAAVHATAALGAPMATDGKVLVLDVEGNEVADVVPAEPERARQLLSASLGDYDRAADSLGHIKVTEQTKLLAAVLEDEGDTSTRSELLARSAETLAQRGVLPGVVEELRSH